MSVVAPVDPWLEMAALASLHASRTPVDLHRALRAELASRLPSVDLALCLADEAPGSQRVELALGGTCPLQQGARVGAEDWPVPDAQRVPIRYGDHLLGHLLSGRPIEASERAVLAAVLAHYAAALVNLTLNAESRQATEHYCASLQALEEGIVLFQEADPDAVLARLLGLAMSMLEAKAGALYVLREIGDAASGLVLDQAMGIPESMLTGFRERQEGPWAQSLMDCGTQLFERGEDGSLATLVPECLPPFLQNLVVLPLRYHGVEAGLCLLFNAAMDASNARDLLGRVQSLGQLGAALLHRLRLEAMTARNRSIARELEIAEEIQKRLLPSRAPAAVGFEFAWRSLAAQRIGGDYLDLLTSDCGDIHAVVADASGHGINSALLMSSFRSTYRAEAPAVEPRELAASLNREVVHEVGATGMFITAVTLRIEPQSRRMLLCSAGHNPVMLYRSGTRQVELLDSHGPPLGFVESADYAMFETTLQPGDVLLLYTDGITEAVDAHSEMFGEERLQAVLQRCADEGAERLLEAAHRELREFTRRDRFDDDVSLCVVRVRQPEPRP